MSKGAREKSISSNPEHEVIDLERIFLIFRIKLPIMTAQPYGRFIFLGEFIFPLKWCE